MSPVIPPTNLRMIFLLGLGLLAPISAQDSKPEYDLTWKLPHDKAACYDVYDAANRYVEDGDLAIDNSAAERALRGIAVGRRN